MNEFELVDKAAKSAFRSLVVTNFQRYFLAQNGYDLDKIHHQTKHQGWLCRTQSHATSKEDLSSDAYTDEERFADKLYCKHDCDGTFSFKLEELEKVGEKLKVKCPLCNARLRFTVTRKDCVRVQEAKLENERITNPTDKITSLIREVRHPCGGVLYKDDTALCPKRGPNGRKVCFLVKSHDLVHKDRLFVSSDYEIQVRFDVSQGRAQDGIRYQDSMQAIMYLDYWIDTFTGASILVWGVIIYTIYFFLSLLPIF